MGGETEKEVSGWTTDTLKSFVAQLTSSTEDRIMALDRRTAELRQEDQKAITKAEAAAEAARAALRSEAVSWKADHNNLIEQLTKLSQNHSEAMVRMTESMASKDALSQLSRSIDEKLVLRSVAFNERMDGIEKGLDQRIDRIDRFQNRLAGGMLVVMAIGITNLVKVWVT